MEDIKAIYFDGLSSTPNNISLSIINNLLTIKNKSSGESITFSDSEYKLFLPVGKTDFKILLNNGNKIFFKYDNDIYKKLSKENSFFSKLADYSERNTRALLSIIFIAFISVLLIYKYALPVGVTLAKPLVPIKIKEITGDNVLKILDQGFLGKTNISKSKKKEILDKFIKFKSKINYNAKVKIYFRDGKKMGANAFAILPNKIILTDQLVRKLKVEEIIAVMAHELGHLKEDHGTEAMLRHSFLAGLSLLIIGGDPGTIQAVALGVAESGYSRAQEKEADFTGIDFLNQARINKNLLADALDALFGDFKEEESGFAEKYLSSHPGTAERTEYIRNLK